MTMKRITVHFSGQVQGVGFRFTVHHLAQGFPVTGYVKNLPDGRVEMVAEGEPAKLDALVESVREAMAGNIRETHIAESPGTGQFQTFGIAY